MVSNTDTIDRNIEAVANQKQELRTANAKLKAMQAEGLFGSALKIDPEALKLFFAILAAGDVSKVARDLEMKDSTLRTQLNEWKRRGKAYAVLFDFALWRKSPSVEW